MSNPELKPIRITDDEDNNKRSTVSRNSDLNKEEHKVTILFPQPE
jgi:hypothetical protein